MTTEKTMLELNIEQLLFNRIARNRLAGYTVETAQEIMSLIAPPATRLPADATDALIWAMCAASAGAGPGRCDPYHHCSCGGEAKALLNELAKAGWSLTTTASGRETSCPTVKQSEHTGPICIGCGEPFYYDYIPERHDGSGYCWICFDERNV